MYIYIYIYLIYICQCKSFLKILGNIQQNEVTLRYYQVKLVFASIFIKLHLSDIFS